MGHLLTEINEIKCMNICHKTSEFLPTQSLPLDRCSDQADTGLEPVCNNGG